MPLPRPGSATAAGVLAIIYGSLFTICNLCNTLGVAAQGAMGGNFMVGGDPQQAEIQKKLQEVLERDVPAYQAYQITTALLGLVLSVTILIGGIGVLNLRSWARSLTVVICLITILLSGIQGVYTAAFVMPAMDNAFQVVLPGAVQQAPGPQAAQVLRLMRTMMTVATIVMLVIHVLLIIYLLIIVMLLQRAHVRAAFASRDRAGYEDESLRDERERRDEEEADWDRPPPREEPPPREGPKDDWRIK